MSVLILEMSVPTYDRIGHAIHETFSSVFGIELKTLKIENGIYENPPRNIAGYVVLRNPEIQGTLSIGFPHETALKIFSNFYGSALEQIDERILEGIGEVTNMVYGTLKKHLNQEGFEFEMFIPFVVLGNEFNHLKEAKSKDSVTIHFASTAGEFWVELSLKKSKKKKKAA